MVESLIGALLPVVFTVLYGYFGGHIKSFSKDMPGMINKLVMSYALPLSLFFTINQMSKQFILANWKIGAWQLGGMIGWWLIVYFFSKYVLKSGPVLSPIRAMALSTPAILFVGPALLEPLFPETGTIAVSVGGLLMNVVMLPLTVVVLSAADVGRGGARSLPLVKQSLTALRSRLSFPLFLVW